MQHIEHLDGFVVFPKAENGFVYVPKNLIRTLNVYDELP